jgi:hypothetical protein
LAEIEGFSLESAGKISHRRAAQRPGALKAPISTFENADFPALFRKARQKPGWQSSSNIQSANKILKHVAVAWGRISGPANAKHQYLQH